MPTVAGDCGRWLVVQLPVQVTVGDVFVPLRLARKPNVALLPGANVPLYDALVTATAEPEVVCVPLQSWTIDWPLGQVQRAVHPAQVVAAWFMISTSPWKPPGHALITL